MVNSLTVSPACLSTRQMPLESHILFLLGVIPLNPVQYLRSPYPSKFPKEVGHASQDLAWNPLGGEDGIRNCIHIHPWNAHRILLLLPQTRAPTMQPQCAKSMRRLKDESLTLAWMTSIRLCFHWPAPPRCWFRPLVR